MISSIKLRLFQSTLSMRRATETCCRAVNMLCISIHALHEESDQTETVDDEIKPKISIHALHEESDPGQGTHP